MKAVMRVLTVAVCLLGLIALASPASAQYRPLSTQSPSTGETYHVEAGFLITNPPLDAQFSSENFGIPGTLIDFSSDFGMADKALYGFRVVLSPSLKQKFRIAYLPQSYEGDQPLPRNIVFNGILFPAGIPVKSTYQWKGWRFGYEYDFVSNDRGFFGVVLEAKYTDVQVQLDSIVGTEYARARAPIPAIGGIGRVYIIPALSVTAELTGFKLPDSVGKDYYAKYIEFDIYGTYYIIKNLGVMAGYRSNDVEFRATGDLGQAKTKGLYFGGVARF